MSLSWRLPVFSAAILTLATAPAYGQAATTDNGGPTLEDLFTVESLGSVRVSPDGQAVLYTVTSSDLEENETNTDIWLLRRDGSGWSSLCNSRETSRTTRVPNGAPKVLPLPFFPLLMRAFANAWQIVNTAVRFKLMTKFQSSMVSASAGPRRLPPAPWRYRIQSPCCCR